MLDQMLDTFRKATESTMHFQQQMFRQWTEQMSHIPGMAGLVPESTPAPAPAPTPPAVPPATATLDQVRELQTKWAGMVSDMLHRHREALDAQYAAGIKTIKEAFKVGEARDPAHFRILTEELWKQSFETLQSVAQEQLKEFQNATKTMYEMIPKVIDAVGKK